MQKVPPLCIKYVKIFKCFVGLSAQRHIVSFSGYEARGLVMSALDTCLPKATGMGGHTSSALKCFSIFVGIIVCECVCVSVRKRMCVDVQACVCHLYMCHLLSKEYSERNPQIRASAARDLWDMYTHNLWLTCS